MKKILKDWRDEFDLSEDDIVEELISPNKICYYCRNEVEADYGQSQVYCQYCQTISIAISASSA
jgi:LSD1 subclass zinc finger protein